MISNNKVERGSTLYISYRSSNSSYVLRNSTFENNESGDHGAVYLYFDDGTIEISGNSFNNNRGIESCISISKNT